MEKTTCDNERRLASDNKSYVVIPNKAYVRFFKALNIPAAEESLASLKVRLVESPPEDACFVVKEGMDDLACPFNRSEPKCLEGKACFERAQVLFEERILSPVTGKKYRLLVKQCPKTKRFYLYQHKVKDGISEIFYCGMPQIQGLVRLITKDSFKNRCICCQAKGIDGRLEIRKESVMNDCYVRCKTCRSTFYVTDHPVIYGEDFDDKCPFCEGIYCLSFSLPIIGSRIKGIYFAHCTFCDKRFVVLASGFSDTYSVLLRDALLEAEFPGLCGMTSLEIPIKSRRS